MSLKTLFNVAGTLTRETLAKGSKSERPAMVLTTEDGTSYALRIKGRNPFQIAPELAALSGQRVEIDEALLLPGGTLELSSPARIAPRP